MGCPVLGWKLSNTSKTNMSKINATAGDEKPNDMNIAIIAAQFNSFIVDQLLEGALKTLYDHGVTQNDIEVIHVPGAFEIPLVAQTLAKSNRFDAIIALGAVIRGETPHFDYVAGACSEGVSEVSLRYDLPVIFGVLTVDNITQANDRSGGSKGNKGSDAAQAAIQMVSVLRKLDTHH